MSAHISARTALGLSEAQGNADPETVVQVRAIRYTHRPGCKPTYYFEARWSDAEKYVEMWRKQHPEAEYADVLVNLRVTVEEVG